MATIAPGITSRRHGCLQSSAEEPSLAELARVITAGLCIEASCKRGKGEVGMDAYQVRTWQGWHHHMALIPDRGMVLGL